MKSHSRLLFLFAIFLVLALVDVKAADFDLCYTSGPFGNITTSPCHAVVDTMGYVKQELKVCSNIGSTIKVNMTPVYPNLLSSFEVRDQSCFPYNFTANSTTYINFNCSNTLLSTIQTNESSLSGFTKGYKTELTFTPKQCRTYLFNFKPFESVGKYDTILQYNQFSFTQDPYWNIIYDTASQNGTGIYWQPISSAVTDANMIGPIQWNATANRYIWTAEADASKWRSLTAINISAGKNPVGLSINISSGQAGISYMWEVCFHNSTTAQSTKESNIVTYTKQGYCFRSAFDVAYEPRRPTFIYKVNDSGSYTALVNCTSIGRPAASGTIWTFNFTAAGLITWSNGVNNCNVTDTEMSPYTRRLNLSILRNGDATNNLKENWHNAKLLLYSTEGDDSLNIEFYNQTPTTLNLSNIFPNIFINYNVTTLSNISYLKLFVNVTCSLCGNNFNISYLNSTILNTNFTRNNVSNEGTIYRFSLSDNELLRGNYLLNYELFRNFSHSVYLLDGTTSNYLKIRFTNITNASINFFEIMANSTAIQNQEVYLCNSSYTTGSIADTNCRFMSNMIPEFRHNHTNYSYHYVVPFPFTNNRFKNMSVTPEMYFILRGGASTNIFYLPNISKANDTQLSNNNGNTYSEAGWTADSHIHQLTQTENISMYVCGNSTLGSYSCSSARNVGIQITLPPTSPQVTSPNATTFNLTNINVIYTSSLTTTTSIINYRIDLLDENRSFSQFIYNNSLNLTYVTNSSNFLNGNFYIRVTAIDNESNNASGFSERFTIANTFPEAINPNGVEKAIDRASEKFMFIFMILVGTLAYFLSLYIEDGSMILKFVAVFMFFGAGLFIPNVLMSYGVVGLACLIFIHIFVELLSKGVSK